MKIVLDGVVKSRAARKNAAGEMRYYLEVEEPGQYPSQFQIMAKDATILGPIDGFARVGARVIVTGYLNGKAEDVESAKHPGKKFRAYRTWITLSTIVPAVGGASAASSAGDDEEVAEDIPF